MTVLTPSDYADTGQWRLLIKIFRGRMTAHLENTLHDDVDAFEIFQSKWDDTEENPLLKIEEAVYSHPRVLDDFAARIVIYENHIMFIPVEIADREEGSEENFYKTLYPCDAEDIMTERDMGIIAAYNPGKGVGNFLRRTFPGTIITSNLMEKVKTLRKVVRGEFLFIERREGETDFILLNSNNLISASTHITKSADDALFHALRILKAYGYEPGEVKTGWGDNEFTDETKRLFDAYLKR